MEGGERVDEKLPETTESSSQKSEEIPVVAAEGAKTENDVPEFSGAEVSETKEDAVQEAPTEINNVSDEKIERLSPETSKGEVDEVERLSTEKLSELPGPLDKSPELKVEEIKCPETSLIEFKGGGGNETGDSVENNGEDRLPHSTTSLRGSESPIPVGNLPPPRSRRPQLLDNLKKKTTSESSEPESLEDEESPPPSVASNPVPKDEGDLPSTYINKRSSLYVKNPDFSKRMHQPAQTPPPGPPPPQSQVVSTIKNHLISNDLSPLRMKPPDFSKVVQSEGKSVSQPPTNVTPSNFEEISRKYNYISDLQLKPQPASTAPSPSGSYRNLYVSAPNFTSHKFQGETSTSGKAAEGGGGGELEEPTAHIIHKKPQYLPSNLAQEVPRHEEAARSYTQSKNQYLPPRFVPPVGYGSPLERAKKYDVKPQTTPKVSYEPKASVIHQQVGYESPKMPVDMYGQRTAYNMMPPQTARNPVVIKHPPSPSGSMNPPQNWPGRVGTPQSPHNGSAHSPNFLQPAPVAYKSSPSPQGNTYYPPNGGTYYAPKTAAKEKPPIDYVDLTKPEGRSHQDIQLRGSPRSESLGRSQAREPMVYEMRHSSSETNVAAYYRHMKESQPVPKDPAGYNPYAGNSSKQSVSYRYPPQPKETIPKTYR